MSIRTLMFGWEYPPLHLGGLGVACQGLVRGLLGNGVVVTLVLPKKSRDQEENVHTIAPTEKIMKSVRIESMLSPYESAENFALRCLTLPREMQQIYGSNLPEAVSHFASMSVEMTRDEPTDIVHCHDWMTYEAGIAASRYHEKPLVAHIHATELDRTHFHPNEWIFAQELRGFSEADRIIAVSNYTKNILVDHYGIRPDKIVVVHNGLAAPTEPPVKKHLLQSTSKPKRHPIVLFLGRMTLQKGPEQFLMMAAAIHKLRPDVQFVMAGDGGMLGEIMQRACVLGLQDCILFSGKVTNDEATRLYERASCFVMPSLSEPFGLVALEAIAHGTPVILSKQSGAAEVVGHAFKVDFWDTDKMADCVLTVLRDQPLAEQLISEAPRVLQRLTWKHQAEQVKAIYTQLLHRSPHPEL
ncbi:MAG: glycosyltransferase family 4 protein [Candidatus Peregrinibacteria bacterium]